MKSRHFLILFSALLFSGVAGAAQRQIDFIKEKSSVEFLAVGRPSAIKIRGEKAKPEGYITVAADKVSGQIKVDLDEFGTGIALRDRHMKEKYLETQKDANRYAVVEISRVEFPPDFWTTDKTGEFVFSGVLSLHGVKKDISGKIKIDERKADSLRGNSSFTIKLTDYGIQIPSFSGITVAENVDVQVNFDAKSSSVK